MKPRIESRPNIPQGTNGSTNRQQKASAVEPPKEPFINLSGDGPVDPAKFQKFIVPMEFIEKANALDLSRVDSESFQDTAPPNRPLIAPDDNAVAQSASDQETVVITNRRKSSPIPKELLENASTIGSRHILKNKLLWLIVAALGILILSWTHWKGNRISTVTSSTSMISPSVPLMAAPPTHPNANVGANIPNVGVHTGASASAPGQGLNEPTTTDVAPSAKRVPSTSVKTLKTVPSASPSKGNPSIAPAASGVVPLIQPE